MTDIFIRILNMSITATYVALIVMLVRILLKKSPKIFSYMLWSVVLFRLISSFNFSSSLSLLLPLNKSSNYVPQNIGVLESPIIDTNIITIDRAINNSLPTATPYASVNPMQVLMSLFTIIWVLGIIVLILYSIYSYIKIYRKIQFATLVKENIYQTDQIITPFVFGFIKPKIYLPKELKDGELDYIISHEKTHIKRYDYLIKPISFLALSLHWFNPVMWVSYYLMIKDMEMSCDESVLKNTGEDLRSDYSSSLLSLSVKQSGLLLPLAFGESNIKSRIKNILNYKKPRFWTILIAIVIVIAISTGLITNPINNTAKNKAEEFLKVYYTIENTDIVDMVYNSETNPLLRDEPIIDENEDGIIEIIGMDEAVINKYGDFMTEDALNRAIANRIILAGEMSAREYGSKLSPEYVNLWNEEISDYGRITYEYSVPALVKFNDGSEELLNLSGSLVLKEDEGSWKVDGFKPDIKELANVLQFGKAYLIITNHSDASIRFIEIITKGNSQGASNADNTDIEKNARFDFDMIDAENLDYTVKLLNQDREVLYERSLTGNFSKGKDVYLYIQEDDTRKLMINRGNANDMDGDNDIPQGGVMVNGVIYLNTGYEVPTDIDKGTILEKITSTIKFYETPTENGQANFEAKGAKYAQYEDDIVVLINNKWILFKNQEEMLSSFSGNDFGFLMADLSDEEIYNVLRTIWKYIKVDEDYEKNIDSIIERSFIECGIDDASIIENAKSKLKFNVK